MATVMSNNEYDNVADRTTAEMMGEHLGAALDLLDQVRPDAKGFAAVVLWSEDKKEAITQIRLVESNGSLT